MFGKFTAHILLAGIGSINCNSVFFMTISKENRKKMNVIKIMVCITLISSFFATSSAFAGHDHGGGHYSSGHSSTPSQVDQHAVNTAGQLLKNCTQHVDSIQRHIDRLQAKISEKRGVSSINNELEALEQKLKDAKEIVRSLQIY